jgi:hypothetical protein
MKQFCACGAPREFIIGRCNGVLLDFKRTTLSSQLQNTPHIPHTDVFNHSMADTAGDQQRTDEATLQQINDISQGIAEAQPLIGDSMSVNAALRGEYINNADSPGFLPGLNYLDAKYKRIRRVRGDGNCFYR